MVYGRETLKVSSLQRAVGKSGNTKGASSNVMGIILPPVAKIWGEGGDPPAPGSYGPAFIAFIEPGNMFHPSGTE